MGWKYKEYHKRICRRCHALFVTNLRHGKICQVCKDTSSYLNNSGRRGTSDINNPVRKLACSHNIKKSPIRDNETNYKQNR